MYYFAALAVYHWMALYVNFTLMQPRILFFVLFISVALQSYSQTTYPKVTGYMGILHPLVTYSNEGTVTNFKDFYVIGFPTGINLWKTANVGFSLEVVPLIRSEKGTSKMSNLLFHPGLLLALGKGYTFVGRAAFETGGRYGFTPVFNKTVKKNKNSSYFVAVPLPVRFGNSHPASLTIGFQFGIAF